jgi:hypothetical protein
VIQRVTPEQVMAALRDDLDDVLDDWCASFGPEQVFATEARVTGSGLLQRESDDGDTEFWAFFRFARGVPGGIDPDSEFGWRFPMSLVQSRFGFGMAAAALAEALSSHRMSDPDEVFDLCWIGEPAEGA